MTHRLHTQVDAMGVARPYPPIPMKGTRYTAEQLKDPEQVARALEQIQKNQEEATRPARSSPFAQAIVIRGVKFTAATAWTYQHRLGRFCDWMVTRWRAASGAQDIREQSNDSTTLVVLPAASGTGDVWIW